MGLFSGNKPSIKIIDRTIPEILALNGKVSRVGLSSLCGLIARLGVDLIEVDVDSLQLVDSLHGYNNLILRLKPQDKIGLPIPAKIKNCIITEAMLDDPCLLRGLTERGIQVALECRAYHTCQLAGLERLKSTAGFQYIHQVRLVGLEGAEFPEWVDTVQGLQECLGVELDICPQNLYFCATSIAVEALLNKVGSVTASFAGYGRCGGFAALEEVLLSMKVFMECSAQYPLHLLPQVRSAFIGLTEAVVPENKPVIGRDIFKYESGIHADGIEKNPTTYEPFDPGMVGLERSLHIGKHSGKSAVAAKLKDLGINSEAFDISSILDTIREKSIELRRGLCDEEIRDVCGVML